MINLPVKVRSLEEEKSEIIFDFILTMRMCAE